MKYITVHITNKVYKGFNMNRIYLQN